MTDQEIFELLIDVDHGYKLTREEHQQLASVTSITLKHIIALPRNIGLLSSVTNLDLSYNRKLSDISALSRMKELTNLDLGYTSVRDISALKGMKGLTNLDLGYTSVHDISALRGMKELTNLDLGYTLVSDISPLSGLTELTNLNLSHNGYLSDISALSGLTGLTNLDLSGTGVSDISALSGLTRLISLDLRGTNVSNISALSGLTGLTNLDLSECWSLTDISTISELTRLSNLDLSYNFKLSDISALSGLTGLNNIDIRGLKLSMIPEAVIDLGLEFISDKYPKGPGIYIYDLKLTNQPIEIFSQNREIIVEYFESLKEEKPVNECKVIFLGDGGAGKTLMIERLMREGGKRQIGGVF